MLSLYEAQMSALAILSQPRKLLSRFQSHGPGTLPRSAGIDRPFAKLIRGCWFATVPIMSEVMSERSPEQIDEQIRELLDSLYRVDSGRIPATLIKKNSSEADADIDMTVYDASQVSATTTRSLPIRWFEPSIAAAHNPCMLDLSLTMTSEVNSAPFVSKQNSTTVARFLPSVISISS